MPPALRAPEPGRPRGGSGPAAEPVEADGSPGDAPGPASVDPGPSFDIGVGAPAPAVGMDGGSPGAATAEDPVEVGGVATQAPPAGRDTTGLVRYQFWTELLDKAAERTRLHEGAEPSRDKVVGASAGVDGLLYNYFVGEHIGGVELFIDRGEGRAHENELAFNALQATEDAISYNFGSPLDWEHDVEGSGAKRVRYALDVAGYADDEEWPELQDQMIDAMIRLEKAMRPHISRMQL